MGFTKALSSLNKNDVVIAGGKGSSLGEMIQAGIPVPSGFVLLSTAFDYFLEKSDLKVEIDSILHSVDINKIHTVENASEKINNLILDSETPEEINREIKQSFKKLNAPFVAIRSSATSEDSAAAAWAGQLNTYLNTTKENLLENIKRCWASLFTPRAIFYRFHQNLHKDHISVAVIVQEMIESEVSGIAFSVHPVTQDRNQLIIEAGLGLGEAIVSGQITPDSYVVEKEGWLILDKKINIQNKAMIRAVSGDNEWKELTEKEAKKQVLSDKEIIELSKLIIKIENHYGFPVDVEFARENGRFYITQSRPITTLENLHSINHNPIKKEIVLGNQDIDTSMIALEMTWVGMRDKRIKQQVGIVLPELYSEIIKGRTINAYVNPEEFRSFVNSCSKTLFENKQLILDIKQSTKRICQNMIEYANENKARIKTLKLEEIPKVLNEIRNMQAECSFWGMVVAFADVFGTITNKSIDILERRKNIKHSTHIYSQVLSGPSERSLTEKAIEEIRRSSDKEKMLECYFWLNQGYIGNGLSLDEINEIKEEDVNKEKIIISKEEAVKELRLTKEELYNFDLLSDMAYVKSLRADCRQFLNVLLNKIIDRLAEAWGTKNEYLETLTIKEVCEIIEQRKDIPSDLKSRYSHSLFIQKDSEDYEVIYGDAVTIFLDEKLIHNPKKEKEELKGNIAYIGKAKGHVKLVFGAQHNHKVKKGDILVSTVTSPQLLPAMVKAAAFITDMGGITSHAAIVARELKKPCIIGTKIATQVLRDGDLVEVDAERGVVKILEKSSVPDKTINWYHDVPNQRIPIYVGYALIESLKEHNEYYKRKIKDLIGSVKGVYSYRACYSEDDIREGAQALLNSCLKDSSFLEKTKQIIIQRGDKLLHSARGIEIQKDASLKRLTDLYRDIYSHYIRYIALITIPELSIDFVEKALDKETKRHFRSQYNKVINILSTPQESFLNKEKKELLKIFMEKNFNDLLEVHVKKYFWLKNNYVDTKYLTKEFFINRFKELKIEKEEDIDKKTEFLDSLKEDKYKQLKILAEIIEFLAFVQDIRKKTFMEVSYYINNLLKEIGSRRGFNSEKMFLLKPEEIFNIDKEIISEQEFNKRKEHVLFYHHQGNNQIYEGKEANKREQAIAPINISEEKSTFYGRTAYTGKVTGLVNILKSIKEMHQLKDDEILVTSNITPEFVPFLNKVKAIITEKGGITSHAAIIGREMQIPSIVGVKHITSILKTGDEIEVDADKGVIKLLKRDKK